MRLGKNIQGRNCFIYESGEPDVLLIQAVDEHEAESLEREIRIIKELTDTPFTLAAFAVRDWNRELSPWESPAVFGDEDFGSGAAETLSFITDGLLPELRDPCGNKPCYLGGYSLAGLFALWAAYQTDLFSGIAAVSPSVWFPGWENYMEANSVLAQKVYLSLGNKEEKTKNKTMAAVGRNIRRQYELLCKSAVPASCILEWNPGNHFSEPDRRIAKGFAWLMNDY